MTTEARIPITSHKSARGFSPRWDRPSQSHIQESSAQLPKGLGRALEKRARQQLPWFGAMVRRSEPDTGPRDKDIAPRLKDGLALAAEFRSTQDLGRQNAIRQRLLYYGDPDYFIGQVESVEKDMLAKREMAARATVETRIHKAARKTAASKLRWLRAQEPVQSGLRQRSDRRLISHRTAGLMDAVDVERITDTTPSTERAQRKMRLRDWGIRADDLTSEVQKFVRPDDIGEEVSLASLTWGESEQRRHIRDTHAYARSLPKSQRGEFYARAGLESEKAVQRLARWGMTLGANAATTAIPLEAALIGGTIAGATPLQKIGTAALAGTVTATEVFWVRNLNKAATQSTNLLEEHGVGTKFWAKFLYEGAGRVTNSRKLRRVAGWIGYAGPQILFELPWAAGAIGAHKLGVSLNETLSIITGINVGGTVGEGINAWLTRKANDMVSR
jgi:hypothetical protein